MTNPQMPHQTWPGNQAPYPVQPPKKRAMWPWVLGGFFACVLVFFGGCALLIGSAANEVANQEERRSSAAPAGSEVRDGKFGFVVTRVDPPVSSVGDSKIVTLAGLGGGNGKVHKIQAAFIEEQVPQCGYCLNGWLMTAAAFLESNPGPSDAEIREALTGLKCRCGTHYSILRAVKRAAQA